MIKEKQKLIGNLNVKQSLSGKLGNAIIFIDPITQEKEVMPTKEVQIIEPDKNYTGLSKVTVNPIPNEYIIPSGEIEFTQNGTYDVADKASAKVNIKEKVLGTKTITKNGTYKASDDDLDGYSEVEVETSGVDINDYYVTSGNYNKIPMYIKKIPLIDTSAVTNMTAMFSGCENLISIPLIDTSNVTNMNSMFSGCKELRNIPQLNTSAVTNMNSMFSGCKSLTTIPQLDTSNVTNMRYMFYDCNSLTTIPLIDTSAVTNMNSTFYNCKNLISIPQLNTSNITDMDDMFYNCSYLTTIPLIDTSAVTSMIYMFSGCKSLTTIPQLDTSNVTNMSNMFYDCKSLTTIPQLDLSKVISVSQMFYSCSALTTLGGFQNLGMAYSANISANYSYYTLNLSISPKLTHDSLMNVINNLYDIKSKGCNPQSLVLGSTNLAKLTAEEIAIATNKGWNVS